MTSPKTPTIHWLGTGLSSVPGLRKLAQQGTALKVWNRTPDKAQEALRGLMRPEVSVHPFQLSELAKHLETGDIVVSMLPASWHPEVAQLCLKHQSHLVTASYLSPEMQAFHQTALEQGLCFVNEMGLDPGLDHFLAYEAVEQLQQTPFWTDPDSQLEFNSLCGGLSEIPNDFRYRFSWSPVGVLKALKNAAVFVKEAEIQSTHKAWTQVENVHIASETFEAYPNRDSVPFIKEYGLDQGAFKLDTFVRGTLRLQGWKEAWSPIFQQVESASDESLAKLSESLWEHHAMPAHENDRVVLFVSLSAASPHRPRWESSALIDLVGNEKGSAMARLVSLPIAYIVPQILDCKIPPGVSGAPKATAFREGLFADLETEGIKLSRKIS